MGIFDYMKSLKKKTVHPYLVKLGAELRKTRIQKGLSLEVLGGEMGLDGSNLQKIELGHNITMTTLLKLCICLKVSPSKLFENINWDLKERDLDSLTTPRPVKKRSSRK